MFMEVLVVELICTWDLNTLQCLYHQHGTSCAWVKRLNVDSRFAQNIEYLFCAQYIADVKQIASDATLAIMLS